MSETGLPTAAHLDPLQIAELRAPIAASRRRLAGAVNAELTRLYWSVGQRLAAEVLAGERAQYGAQLMDRLGQRLARKWAAASRPRTCAAWCSSPAFPTLRMSHH